MRRSNPISAPVALLALSLALVSCRTMRLQDLDQAIPTPLVEDYAASTSDYADETFLWLPLLLSSTENVARIAGGFEGRGDYTLGPLGVIRSAEDRARWAEDGSRRAYSHAAGWLWGILYSSEEREALTNKGWRTASRQKILFGLIGYGGDLDGGQTFYIFWIPLCMRLPDADLAIDPDVIVPSG